MFRIFHLICGSLPFLFILIYNYTLLYYLCGVFFGMTICDYKTFVSKIFVLHQYKNYSTLVHFSQMLDIPHVQWGIFLMKDIREPAITEYSSINILIYYFVLKLLNTIPYIIHITVVDLFWFSFEHLDSFPDFCVNSFVESGSKLHFIIVSVFFVA